MRLPENAKHDLLLAIVSMLFILFATGCADGGNNGTSEETVVIS